MQQKDGASLDYDNGKISMSFVGNTAIFVAGAVVAVGCVYVGFVLAGATGGVAVASGVAKGITHGIIRFRG
ncbi:hypothetical protein [Helicobacter cetorum]|uniref:hypothetical protein n=1 Tax=Helicobacter cetorum TaxID=138563 RepID=UPI000CF1BEF0|nr:hypothetical protein [Helicobacter cetorum]